MKYTLISLITTKLENKTVKGELKEQKINFSLKNGNVNVLFSLVNWNYGNCTLFTKYLKVEKTKKMKTRRLRSVAYFLNLPHVGKMYSKVDIREDLDRGKHFVEMKLSKKNNNI